MSMENYDSIIELLCRQGILHDLPGVRGCLEEDVDEDELVEDGEGEAEPP